jgi:hypothetical protein
LRRFIFIELRLSCLPTARKMHSARRIRQAAHRESHAGREIKGTGLFTGWPERGG